MGFLERIAGCADKLDYGKKLIEELKFSPYPNYIYGAGYLGFQYLSLKKLGVPIAGVVIDDDYWHDGLVLGEYIVESMMNIGVEGEINLIVGFDEALDHIRDRIPKYVPVYKIYYLDPSSLEEEHISYQYVLTHLTEFEQVYEFCADELSRDVFVNFINTKITHNATYLDKVCTRDIYFPKDILKVSNDEVFIDCGAYTGDTLLLFKKKSNDEYNRIYAFEPDKDNLKALQQTIHDNSMKNVIVHPFGVWDKKDILEFTSPKGESQTGSYVDGCCRHDGAMLETISLPVDSIDSTISIRDKVTYIKMDIEGSELKALKGAENTIKTHKPKCAISAYHTKADICGIPLFLKSLNPDYKIYFRQHHYVSWDMVCYAV